MSAQNKELQREMERLQSEVTRYKNLQLKAAKDCEKYKDERDSVFNEYRLIMSERDQVIKELDKLQTELEAAEARLKNTSSERVVASEELEALRQVSHFLECDQHHLMLLTFNIITVKRSNRGSWTREMLRREQDKHKALSHISFLRMCCWRICLFVFLVKGLDCLLKVYFLRKLVYFFDLI